MAMFRAYLPGGSTSHGLPPAGASVAPTGSTRLHPKPTPAQERLLEAGAAIRADPGPIEFLHTVLLHTVLVQSEARAGLTRKNGPVDRSPGRSCVCGGSENEVGGREGVYSSHDELGEERGAGGALK